MTRQSHFAALERFVRQAWKKRRLIEAAFSARDTSPLSILIRRCLGATALGCLVLAAGCRNHNLVPATNGIGGALSPTAVQEYARQHGISDAQAQQELQQKVSQFDEEKALKNIDENGALQP